ncbi:hypothetical protein ACSBR2_038815 [Camellia fascicularis]
MSVSSTTVNSSSSSWARAMLQISPYTFFALDIAIAIGVSVLGTAWGIYITDVVDVGDVEDVVDVGE